MNAKPKDAIERMRAIYGKFAPWEDPNIVSDIQALLAYLDAIPDGAVPVVWPADLTRERLEELARQSHADMHMMSVSDRSHALRALAAIAPQKKKRVVNLWQRGAGTIVAIGDNDCPLGDAWRCVARNVELED